MGQCSHAPGHEEVVIDGVVDGEVDANVDAMDTAMEQGGEVMTYSGYQAAPVGNVSAAPPVDGSVAGITVGAGGSAANVPVEGSVKAVSVVTQLPIYDAATDGQFYESFEAARQAAEAAESNQLSQPIVYEQPIHFQQPMNMNMQPQNIQQFPYMHNISYHQQPNHQFMAAHQTHPEIVNNDELQPEAQSDKAEPVVEVPAEVVEAVVANAVVADADGVAPEVEDVEVADEEEEKVTEEAVENTESKPKKKKKRFGWF